MPGCRADHSAYFDVNDVALVVDGTGVWTANYKDQAATSTARPRQAMLMDETRARHALELA